MRASSGFGAGTEPLRHRLWRSSGRPRSCSDETACGFDPTGLGTRGFDPTALGARGRGGPSF